MRRNKVVLVWEASRLDHMVVEVLVAYTVELVVSSKVQKSTQPSDSI